MARRMAKKKEKAPETARTCRKCGIEKPIEEFIYLMYKGGDVTIKR